MDSGTHPEQTLDQYAIQIRIHFTSKPFCNNMYGGWPWPSGPRPIIDTILGVEEEE